MPSPVQDAITQHHGPWLVNIRMFFLETGNPRPSHCDVTSGEAPFLCSLGGRVGGPSAVTHTRELIPFTRALPSPSEQLAEAPGASLSGLIFQYINLEGT